MTAAALEPLAQSVLELAAGSSYAAEAGADEVALFVISGNGALVLDGASYPLAPESGASLRPGETYSLEVADGEAPLRLVEVRIHDPEPVPDAALRAVVRRLADQEAESATGEREFRIVGDPDSGLASATHFVGYIPRGRAPVHFHTYDEVIYVLDGEGALHAGGQSRPIGAGSRIVLHARQLHCLENSGDDVMRVQAVFRPAGSPAAAYYPDGKPAHPAAPPLGATVVPNPNQSPQEEINR